MLERNIDELWKEAVQTCNMHFERMNYASQRLKDQFPLTEEAYLNWHPGQISLTDQMIYRFSKLQDAIGNKIFRLILSRMEEDIDGLTFKDILLKLEKFKILEDFNIWLKLRETRNIVTHEYPQNVAEIVEGLNILKADIDMLAAIWNKLKNY